jgi:hypothetical protein
MFTVWQSGLNLWNKLNDMEVTVKNDKEVTELPFPKLMIAATGEIVAFKEPNKGVCIYPKEKANHYSTRKDGLDEWLMEEFTDFKGEITIKQ